MSERERTDERAGDEPLLPLPWAEEQRLLGVGVRVQRNPRVRAHHLPALARAQAALRLGAHEPLDELVAERLGHLRQRLWRSPYWCTRLRALGGSPDDLGSLDDLAGFPTLSRDEYAAVWRELVDVDGDAELHLATSSGSTGQALLVPRSGYDGVHMWAAIRFWIDHLHVRLPEHPRLVLLCTLPGGLEYSVRSPQLHGGALHRLSTLRPRALARLAHARPALLSTDPAGLHWLLGHADALPGPRPRLVLSSAQHLAAPLREAATLALDAPLINYYATTELGPIAWECLREPARFHVLHPDVWVESLAGELVVTRLRDGPLPLVRYLTGDRGEVLDDDCSCGVVGRSIVGFTGRHPCAFLLPDGREVDAWSLSWLFKDIPLVRFELAQVGDERFELTVDEAAVLPMELALLCTRLVRTLVRLGFARPQLDVRRASLPASAKPQPFVCRSRRTV